MNNLEIITEERGDEMLLTCSGRLDANRSGHLNDHIEKLVREGHYHIVLDLEGIEYLSSSGIRTLVKQYKNLSSINGWLFIQKMSANVEQVLNMVGMAGMLTRKPETTKSPTFAENKPEQHEAHGFVFHRTVLSREAKTGLEIYGKPELTFLSGFTSQDARTVRSASRHFAFGLGAIGNSFDECRERFGEYMMMERSVAYLPADGTKKPDYMVAAGQLVVPLTELYGIHFTAGFSQFFHFEPSRLPHSISLSQLAEALMEFTGYERIAFVMIAESGGLIGTSLNTPPLEGRKIFSFPEIKESVNFTTEPSHLKMLTLSTGYLSNGDNGEAEKFVRAMSQGSTLKGHVHTAVFPYIPLKRTNIDIHETIDFVFNNVELTDILHLTNDFREITGQGDSHFMKGFCWVVPIDTVKIVTS